VIYLLVILLNQYLVSLSELLHPFGGASLQLPHPPNVAKLDQHAVIDSKYPHCFQVAQLVLSAINH
jgi:hypothetical protein